MSNPKKIGKIQKFIVKYLIEMDLETVNKGLKIFEYEKKVA